MAHKMMFVLADADYEDLQEFVLADFIKLARNCIARKSHQTKFWNGVNPKKYFRNLSMNQQTLHDNLQAAGERNNASELRESMAALQSAFGDDIDGEEDERTRDFRPNFQQEQGIYFTFLCFLF
jgi:hypothetical protein